MADFSIAPGYTFIESFGADTATSTVDKLTGLTGSVSGWTELIASTAADCDLLELYLANGSTAKGNLAVDIGVGAANFEELIVEDFTVAGKGNGLRDKRSFLMPLHIPKGSRLAIRARYTKSSPTEVEYLGQLYAASFTDQKGFSFSTVYGIVSGKGTPVDPGGTAHEKGPWEEIESSMADDCKGTVICFGPNDNGTTTSRNYLVDVAIGPSDNEEIILENHRVVMSTAEEMVSPRYIPLTIPSGTRVACRAQCDIIDATDRLLEFWFQGFK